VKKLFIVGTILTAFFMQETTTKATPEQSIDPVHPLDHIDHKGGGTQIPEEEGVMYPDGDMTTMAQPPSDFIEHYKIKSGDSLWKIATQYEVGVHEIISANPQFTNPNLIHVGETVYVPNLDSSKNVEKSVLDLTNIEREKAGLKPLTMNWQLSRVARYKSQDMATENYFSHQSPTYGSPFDMMKQFEIKYSYAGENIAKGQQTSQAVMSAWMNSQGHKANILSPNFTQLGVGFYQEGNTCYWTQQFIKP
jgi:uncharacterized YkwD family protein